MDYDFVVVGSGFGGSVAALRLAEKGYRVVVLEKGRRYTARDFPRSNWNLARWFWAPALGWRGFFKLTFLRHVTIGSGVGVGGGSLVYGNTLPVPRDSWFTAPAWRELADWKNELLPHYATALRMMGAVENPLRTPADEVIRQIGEDLGRRDFRPTTVAVHFGEPGVTVPDPYFGGEGPARTGCTACGGCFVGCRHGAKNTLDQNYLHLAQRRGAEIEADTLVTWVRPAAGGGYEVDAVTGTRPFGRRRRTFTARNVIFAGGTLGTVELLLRLRASPAGLPALSDRVGDRVLTNSESLIVSVSRRRDTDYSKGVAITSILQTDEHSHLEPCRYPAGSGVFRLLCWPKVEGSSAASRLLRLAVAVLAHPLRTLRLLLVPDWARAATVLLFMRTTEGHLRLHHGRRWFGLLGEGLFTGEGQGPAPQAEIPEATDLARRYAARTAGDLTTMVNETVGGIPTTAHVLGGCCMGSSPQTGVIDAQHRVHGHPGLYVVDGSAISANPGVNPSLTILAMAERAMSFIPENAARAEA